MINYLATAADSWQLTLDRRILHYNYTATGEPMVGLEACNAVIDAAGCLHILVTLVNRRQIYARWRGHRWESRELPVNGTVLSLALDGYGQPHILLRKSGYKEIIHLYQEGSRWRQLILPFNIKDNLLLFKPLSHGQMLLFSQEDIPGEESRLCLTVFDPVKGWQVPHYLIGLAADSQNYLYGCAGYLGLLSWHRQVGSFLVKWSVIEPQGYNSRSLYLGTTGDLPDDQPVLLTRDKTLLFLWTSSNRLAFCFSEDKGLTWSSIQSAYFFFPARIKAVEGPEGPSAGQVAFTKISGLEPEWPLIVGFEPLFSLCKAVLVSPGDNEASWKQ